MTLEAENPQQSLVQLNTLSSQLSYLEKEPEFSSLACLSQIHINKENDKRILTCFCGKKFGHSLLPHIKQEHPEIWQQWRAIFVILRNCKWSTKKIMEVFRVGSTWLFSWTVIERELMKMEAEGEANLQVWQKEKVLSWEPFDFELEQTTVWDFPTRGNWAVHQSDYRGNWPPQLVRNLLASYTKKGDTVVDLFLGGGTTLIECWLMERRGVGIDISDYAIKIATARLAELKSKASKDALGIESIEPTICKGDSRECGRILEDIGIKSNSIAMICAHPPYLNALRYTENIQGDLSRLRDVPGFMSAIRTIAAEAKPWLKRNGIFAVLIGDVRRDGKLEPLGFMITDEFLRAGYVLKEIIIKTQNKDLSTNLWARHRSLKFRIAHEYLLIFSK